MSTRADRRFWVVLAAISLVALAWRVTYVIWQRGRIDLYGDAAYYHWQSIDLSRGLGFLDPPMYEFYGRVTPSAGHPPTYLLYLAGVSKVIGTSELTHRLASCLLGGLAVFVIGMLARKVFGRDGAGWLAAILAGAYAHLWINDEMLMSESMYVLMSVIAIFTAYRFWDRRTLGSAALMGAMVGLAVLSRAEALALFPFMVLPLALMLREYTWPTTPTLSRVSTPERTGAPSSGTGRSSVPRTYPKRSKSTSPTSRRPSYWLSSGQSNSPTATPRTGTGTNPRMKLRGARSA